MLVNILTVYCQLIILIDAQPENEIPFNPRFVFTFNRPQLSEIFAGFHFKESSQVIYQSFFGSALAWHASGVIVESLECHKNKVLEFKQPL